MKNRGGVGVPCHTISEKTGLLCGIESVSDDDDLMMITDAGTIIRTPVCDVPHYSRTAGGVIMMRLGEGQTLVNFTRVPKEEEEDAIDSIEEIEGEGVAAEISDNEEIVDADIAPVEE